MFSTTLLAVKTAFQFTDDPLVALILYFTIALIGAGALLAFFVWKFKKDRLKEFGKTALALFVGYAIGIIVIMAKITADDIKASADMETYGMLFYPLLSLLVIAVAGGISSLIASFFSSKAVKIVGAITGLGVVGAFIAVMVEMSKYFQLVKGYYPGANTTGLIVSAVVCMALIAVIYLIGNKTNISDTRSIVYGAIAIALSFALSYVRFFKMPQGGSVTFASLLPLLIYCFMFGTRKGVIVCLVYGTLQAIQDPWIIHPMQFLLDYPLAFGLVGISGIFMEKNVFKGKKIPAFLLGGILAVTLRFACHVFSGVFAFADMADLDSCSSVWAYSLAYNSFAFMDMAICLVAGCLLFGSKTFANQVSRSSGLRRRNAVVIDDEQDGNDEIESVETVEIDGASKTAVETVSNNTVNPSIKTTDVENETSVETASDINETPLETVENADETIADNSTENV